MNGRGQAFMRRADEGATFAALMAQKARRPNAAGLQVIKSCPYRLS
jgi:hypothetical protein